MPPIPAACQSIADRIEALEQELDALQRDLAGLDRPKDEPGPGPGEKGQIGRQINKLRAEIRDAKRDLAACTERNTPPPSPDTRPDLRVRYVEVNQSVQTGGAANRIRLIRNRSTVVRVFVVSGVDNGFDAGAGRNRWPGVTGDLEVIDPATGSSGAALQPVNPGGVVTAMPLRELDTENLGHSLNYRLPLSSVSTPSIELRARIWVRGHYGEGGGWSAESSTTVELRDRRPQEVTPILLIDTVGGAPPPTMATFVRVLRRGALARLPVPFFSVNPPITLPVTQDLTSVLGWAGMLSGLATINFIGRRSGGIRCGLLPFNGAYPVSGMGIPRIGFTAPAFASVPDEDTFAHEMGHTHGLDHALCTGAEPWPHDSRLPGRTNATGLHIEDMLIRRRGTGELMGYCPNPTWPSIETYDHVYDNPA
ncbi:hypothetical protein [Streptomyces sp. KL116D]|uniref:hypothetical protein n=1 Tax=Streptomyces sp. KL116D TaxID=3045152 RepID=UPI003556F58B